MTNSQKFKTAEERAKAFNKYCDNNSDSHGDCKLNIQCRYCHFVWLDLEYKDEILPCPFCGSEVIVYRDAPEAWVDCKCGYSSKTMNGVSDAIAAHNRVARAALAEASGEVENV